MPNRSCDACTYYLRRANYCALLAVKVKDPKNPPCEAEEGGSNSRGIAEVSTTPSTASSVSTNFGPVATVTSPSNPPPVAVDTQLRQAQPQPVAQQVMVPAEAYRSFEDQLEIVPTTLTGFDYASTGIRELDEALGGGFIKGKTYLVAGETGCGKTIFSIQFLLTGVLLYDEPGVYIAIDEPTEQLLKGLKRFGWDVGELIRRKKLVFLDMRTHFSKIYLREERRKIEPKFIIESILNAAKKIKAKRLVIDPIAPLIYGGSQEDVLYVREFLREMVFAIESLGTLTTVMTSEIPTGSKQLSRFGVEEFLASGIIVLGLEELKGDIMRVMYLRKARWAPAKPTKFIFDIVPATGIVIRGLYRETV
ncbi:MAG: ATPase domain-containing protein [Thermofilaceae archaeon]